MINALSYVLIGTPDLPAWIQMATTIAGLQAEEVEPGKSVRLRLDDKVQRLLLQAGTGKPTLGMGYTVTSPEALTAATAKLEAAGFSVTPSTAEERALRGVSAMAHFIDPDGYRVELAHGLQSAATPFVPGRPIGGFRTRAGDIDLGIGHTALMAGDFAAMKHLYHEVLGFAMSDRATAPFVAEFFHVNPRHHTIGLADTGTGPGVYHLMLEYKEWDDVGRAYDMALEQPESIGVSLGRHSNDHVTSFYLRTPDGWMLELGWAGRLIGKDWQISELPGMSLWGHDRTWLPPAKREQARQILKDIAAQGLRAPIAPTE
ncbi:VOC family protein [Ottowia thiooxydans]|uniref:VOC family protein n=1 Tax=Ottowia thiooxydans TaxID=219182 RepID=UPI000420D4AF|nr:VOC family protein [Ottowia thiooxydans]